MPGEFEYLILSAAANLGEEAYGAAMRAAIETTTGRACPLGALYTTLDRLEAKGLWRRGWASRRNSAADVVVDRRG